MNEDLQWQRNVVLTTQVAQIFGLPVKSKFFKTVLQETRNNKRVQVVHVEKVLVEIISVSLTYLK